MPDEMLRIAGRDPEGLAKGVRTDKAGKIHTVRNNVELIGRYLRDVNEVHIGSGTAPQSIMIKDLPYKYVTVHISADTTPASGWKFEVNAVAKDVYFRPKYAYDYEIISPLSTRYCTTGLIMLERTDLEVVISDFVSGQARFDITVHGIY